MKIIEWMKTPSGIKKVNMVLIAALGLMLIGMAIVGTIMSLDEPLIDVEWSYAIMPIYAYGGVIVLLCANRPPRIAIFVGGITFAVMNFIEQIVIITQIGNVPSAILSTIMDVVMFICSLLCLIGDRHSSVRLLWICVIHFATVFTAQMLDVLEITDMFDNTTFLWMTLSCIFLIMFILLLLRPGIREESVKSRIRKGIAVVGPKLVTGPSASISKKDVSALIGKNRSGWTDNVNAECVTSEYTTAVHEEDRTTYLISYIWKDEQDIRITVTSESVYRPYGSGFILRSYSIEKADGNRYLRLYGDDGFFIRLLIEQDEVESIDEDLEPDEPVQYIKDKILTG